MLQLIEDCRAGKVNLILAKSIARFARNVVDCLSIIEELRNLNPPVGVYFDESNLYTLDTTGALVLTIVIPELSQYSDIAEFYSSAFHEIVHSTGSANRLNRLSCDTSYAGYQESYSKEELIAEIGSAFLCNHCGVESNGSFSNSVSYIKGVESRRCGRNRYRT